jgi:3-hydroxyisobutyrate dehydrogenase-like beta-hydroxyacid dehydrogenase
MAKPAFLGLGLMDTPMATRLLEAGHDLTAWNRTSAKTEAVADRGASAASSPAEAVTGAVITMLATRQALQQVLFAEAVRSKPTHIGSGTYPPTFQRRLALKDLHLVTESTRRRS